MTTLPVPLCTSPEASPDVDWNSPCSIAALSRTAYPAGTDTAQDPAVVTLIRSLEVRWFELAPESACSAARSWLDLTESNDEATHWTAYHTNEGQILALMRCETKKMERPLFVTRNRGQRPQASATAHDHSLREEPALAWGPLSPAQIREWHLHVPGNLREPFQEDGGERFLNGVLRAALISTRLQRWPELPGTLAAITIIYIAPVYRSDVVRYYELRRTPRASSRHEILLEGRNADGEPVERVTVLVVPSYQPQSKFVRTATSAVPSRKEAVAVQQNVHPATPAQETPALVAPDITCTREELLTRSAAWAASLQARGIGRQDIVAVHLGRHSLSVMMPVALALLQATYFPLNPEDPAERVANWLERAKPTMAVTECNLAPHLPALPGARVFLSECISLDASGDAHALIPQKAEHCMGDYLMGTSGTSGEPKLVHIRASELRSYIAALNQVLPVTREDIFTHTATFSFSASIRQLHLPLFLQAPLVLADEEERRHPRSLLRRIASSGATVWDTVPSFWKRCINHLRERPAHEVELELCRLRHIFLTGEPLLPVLISQWRDLAGNHCGIHNLYSQTETAGSVSCWHAAHDSADVPHHDGISPCGHTLPDICIHILDDLQQPVSRGEGGEVWVSGPRYHGENRRTGDYGRLLEDGSLHILGRVDRQIKVRGFRVNLDELESVMQNIHGVREAAVALKNSPLLEPHLVAFVALEDSSITESFLREQLLKRLPASHMPRAILVVDSLPRTNSGKVALPKLDTLTGASGEDLLRRSPPDHFTSLVLSIWEQVLGRKVPLDARFQDLGGDSLAAVDVLTALETHLQSPLPPALMQQLTTAREFSAGLEAMNMLTELPSSHSRNSSTDHSSYRQAILKSHAGRNGYRQTPDALLLRVSARSTGCPTLFFCANGLEEVRPLALLLEGACEVWMVDSGYGVVPSTQSAIEEVASLYVAEIAAMAKGEPVRLLGYSYSCQLASELAARLSQRDIEVDFLGWLDNRTSTAPAYLRYRGWERRMETLRFMWENARAANGNIQARILVRSLLDTLRRHLLPQARATDNFASSSATESRYNTPPLKVPLHLFIAQRHWLRNLMFPTLGWSKATFPKLHVWPVPGTHHTVCRPEHAPALARCLRHLLSGGKAMTNIEPVRTRESRS